MKAYVRYYGPEPEPRSKETDKEKDLRLSRPIIQFASEDAAWKLLTKEQADGEMLILRRADFRVQTVPCEFAVEELSDGAFAILWTNAQP